MKKVLLVLILVTISFSSSYSQFFSSFKFEEGFNAAKTAAEKKIGANSKFRAAAAAAGDFNVIKSKVDLATAKCEVWVYVFESATIKDSIEFIPYIKSFGGYVDIRTVAAGVDFSPYLASLPKSTVTSTYIQSDVACNDIKSNSVYKDFMTANPSSTVSFLVLGNNEVDKSLKIGDAYWNTNVTDGIKTLNCTVHSVTRETVCKQLGQASVESENPLKNAIFPNPANDYVYLELNSALVAASNEITIIDINGNKVMDLSLSLQTANGKIQIPTAMLSNGNYFLQVKTNENTFTEKFTIVK